MANFIEKKCREDERKALRGRVLPGFFPAFFHAWGSRCAFLSPERKDAGSPHGIGALVSERGGRLGGAEFDVSFLAEDGHVAGELEVLHVLEATELNCFWFHDVFV